MNLQSVYSIIRLGIRQFGTAKRQTPDSPYFYSVLAQVPSYQCSGRQNASNAPHHITPISPLSHPGYPSLTKHRLQPRNLRQTARALNHPPQPLLLLLSQFDALGLVTIRQRSRRVPTTTPLRSNTLCQFRRLVSGAEEFFRTSPFSVAHARKIQETH